MRLIQIWLEDGYFEGEDDYSNKPLSLNRNLFDMLSFSENTNIFGGYNIFFSLYTSCQIY